MRARTIVAVATIAALPVTTTFAGDATIAGDQSCVRPAASETDKDPKVVFHYLVSYGWIMGWVSAVNRSSKGDILAKVRLEHVTDLIIKYCQGSATVEEAGLSVLAQLRIEYAARMEYKRQTGKDAPQE